MSAAPDSWAITCWVRSAIRAERSVGSASASSKPLVCSDWVPPQTAAKPCRATRMMLTSGCWACSVTPPVWVWKRIICERGFSAPKRSRDDLGPHPPHGAELGDLLEDVVVAVEEEGEPRRELVDRRGPRSSAAST